MAVNIFSIKEDMELGQLGNILSDVGVTPLDATILNRNAHVRTASELSQQIREEIQSRINSAEVYAPGAERGGYLKQEDVVSGTSYTTYHSYKTRVLGPGVYRVGWNFGFKCSNTSTSGQAKILLDGTELAYVSKASQSQSDIHDISGFRYITIETSGTHTISLQVRQSQSSGRVTFIFACFEFEVMD